MAKDHIPNPLTAKKHRHNDEYKLVKRKNPVEAAFLQLHYPHDGGDQSAQRNESGERYDYLTYNSDHT